MPEGGSARRPEPGALGRQHKAEPEPVGQPNSTASGPLACSVRARAMLSGLNTRMPSTCPPLARAPYRRASARAVVWAFPAGISALRQAGVFMSATGFHHGACAARAAVIMPQSYRAAVGNGGSMAGRPARWLSSRCTGRSALPAWANSGQ
jgi:hypothetical protein